MNNRTTLCNNERNTFDVKCKSEKQRYHNLSSAFLLASVLLMATFVAWPNQAAYAHDSGLHDFCWDQTLNAFDFLPDLVPFFFFFLKIIALLVALALGSALSLLCAPQIVPPATNTILLTCNTFGFDPARNAVIGGFKAKSGETKSDSSKFITKTADPFTLAPGSPPTFGEFRMTGTNDDGDNVGFTVIHFVESFLTWILIVFPIIFSLIPGGGKIFNKVKDVLNFAISTALGFLDYKFFMKQNAPLDGHISHPVARPNFINTNKDHNHFYPLGANTIEYSFPWGTASGGKETADFKFNVIDTETPQIIFSNKTIKLEANAHFGFIVNSATRAQLGTVTMEDDCFPEKPATYKGQSFYSLTNIAGPQTAKWEVSETSYSIHEFSPEDPAIKAGGASLSVTKEIAKVFYGKWLEKKTFQEVQILQDQIDEIRDLRRNGATQVADLELSIDKRNAQIDDLELGLKNSDDPKLKGIFGKNIDKDKLSKELADQKKKLSADEVELSTKKVKIANAIDDVKLESLSKQLKKKNFKLKELGGKFGGKLGGAALGAVFAVGGAALGGEWAAKPQPVAVTPIGSNSSLQNIIVEDTLAPNILVLDNVALEVNTTDAEVKIEILPPLVFDIADPFPTLTHNATGSFTELEGDTLKETFKLGQTLIMWNATDFSGNKSPLVKQIVNIKLFGTNNASAAFNHTIPDAFSDFPIDITLNATNLDGDPLEFFIQQSPESGRILSPIDAVFLNKFQLKGTISKLKGITVDDLENVFLTDSENQRVMKLDSDGMFDIAFTTDSVSDRPEAIDAVDSDTYIISDWENNLIVRADVVGNSSSIEKQFDVTGLFEEPKNIANFSNSIFVTDKQNGTVTKLTEFSIFDDLKGISVDENDNVYVVDFGQHKLVKFTKQGIFQSKFSGPPGDPYGIAINQTHILATNLDGNNIESLDMNGNFVSEFGQSGTADGDFDTPLDVELNGTKIYVVDTGNDRIQIFNSTTVHLTSIGSLGGGDGEFDDPQGLAVNGSDIFVADTNNHRIQRINLAAPFFVDDYSNENLWNPFGENVTVNSNTSGIVNFTNVSSGTQTFENGVRRNIGTTLPDDGWTSQFDLITGNNTSNSTGFIWLLTNSTTHPSSADNVDALAVYLNSTQLKIFQEHDGTNSTSSGINITNNTQYFLTFERQAKSQVKLSVFSDPQRQNLIDNPIFNNDTNQNLSDLQILQHTNDNSTGGDPLNLVLDNSTIKPFKFSWIGSCTSGANCNDMTQQSLGLICTSETCIRAANPSSSSQGHFNSPSDVAVNGTHIFAVDTSNGRIQAFNQTGFFVQQIGKQGVEKGNFTNPIDISFDSTGNFYVTDSQDRVQKFNAAGTLEQVWIDSINTQFEGFKEHFNLSPAGINAVSLDIDSTGKVFVLDSNDNKILKLIPEGGNITGFNIPGINDPKNIAINSTDHILVTDNSTRKIFVFDNTGSSKGSIDVSANVTHLNGIAIDDSDNILVSDWTPGFEKVINVNSSGAQIGPPLTLDAIFSNPQDIATNGTFFWITDNVIDNKKIVQIRSDKGKIGEFSLNSTSANFGISLDKKGDSSSIVFTNSTLGSIYKLNTTTDSISELNNIGSNELAGITTTTILSRFLGIFVTNGTNGIMFPSDITFGPDKNLYVGNRGDSSIKRYSGTSGAFIDNFTNPGDGDLMIPRDMIFDSAGDLLISSFDTSSSLSSVKLYDGGTGEYIEDFISSTNNPLQSPTGLVFDKSGDLLVSNEVTNQILKFSGTDGTYLESFTDSSADGGLDSPQSLAFGPDDNLYVVSRDSNEILQYDETGGFIKSFVDSTLLSNPLTLEFDFPNDFLYVTTEGVIFDKVLQFNATTGNFIGEFTGGDLSEIGGIALDDDGNLFVSNFNEHQVLKYGKTSANFFVADWTTGGDKQLIGLNSTGDVQDDFVFDVSTDLIDPRNISSDSSSNIWVADFNGTVGFLVNFDGGTGELLNNTVSLSSIPTFDVDDLVILTINDDGDQVVLNDDGVPTNFTGVPKVSIIPEGIALDSEDSLYVSDWNNNRIVKLSFEGLFLEQFKLNSTLTNPKDFDVIDEVDFVRILVSDADTGKIEEFRSDRLIRDIELQNQVSDLGGITKKGDPLTFIGSSSNLEKMIAQIDNDTLTFRTNLFVEPEGISVLSSNEIYVTDWKEERILKLNSNGDRIQSLNLTFANFLESSKLRDIDVQIDGSSTEVWVSDSRKAQIPKLQLGIQDRTIREPSVADKFVFMSSLAVNSEDDFYVTSTENSTFVKFTERGSFLKEVPVPETQTLIDVSTQFNPISENDTVYLAMGMPPLIKKYNSTLTELGTKTLGTSPTSVVGDSKGDIYVSFATNTISRLSSDFAPKADLPTTGLGSTISDMVVDSRDFLYAADNSLHRIHKFNLTSTEYLGWIGKCDTIGTNADCNLNDNHTNGFVTTASNTKGPNDGGGFNQFFEPSAVTVDRTGNLFVADTQKSGILNSPRIQKFSNSGFFIENFLSNTSNTMVKGNFENPQSIATGSNFFYVADIQLLHFFDVNPFSPVNIDFLNNNLTTANVTYQANINFPQPPSPFDFDEFKYFVSDGFEDSNLGNVSITVNNPDLDGDGIFFTIDTLTTNSTEFLDGNSTLATGGNVTDYGDQNLTIRDARLPEDGVFIQADVTPNVLVSPESATINACHDTIEMQLNPGNRLILTCDGGKVEVIRGNIQVIFSDSAGRTATTTIGVGDALHFDPMDFGVLAPETNIVNHTINVEFNGKQRSQLVPIGDEVIVDTLPPPIEENCSDPITLQAEINAGVNATVSTTTTHFGKVSNFLNLRVEDVDNGTPQFTQGMNFTATHNATIGGLTIFPLNETRVQFDIIDDIGNKASCISSVLVEDTIKPKLRADVEEITVETPLNDDVAVVHYLPGEIFDLPDTLNAPEFDPSRRILEPNLQPLCIPISGSTFIVGETPVGCVGADKSGNVGNTNFTVIVNKNPVGVFVNSITASDAVAPNGLSDGDKIIVKFSQATNQPTANSKSDIDDLFNFTKIDGLTSISLGTDYTGIYLDESTLLISLVDTSGNEIAIGDTKFIIKSNANLTSASGIFMSEPTPSTPLEGSFTSIPGPFITAFVADDPVPADQTQGTNRNDDIEISVGDVLIIRFSESTNVPGGLGELTKNEVDNLFGFEDSMGNPKSPGDDYHGEWVNPLTFKITIDIMGPLSTDPVLGNTTAFVKPSANLRNLDGTSDISISKSEPLTGSFGPFSITKSVEPNGTATATLPSGLSVGIKFPSGDDALSISRANVTSAGIFKFLGNSVQITPSSNSSCIEGCLLTFSFNSNDLAAGGFNLGTLVIFHDTNDDEDFNDANEILFPTITSLPNSRFIAEVKVFQTSFFGIGSISKHIGGSGGDETPPNYLAFDYISCDLVIGCGAHTLPEIRFENDMPTATIPTGHTAKFILRLNENSGPAGLQHVSLYTNIRGYGEGIQDSDTYVRFNKGDPVIVKDSNELLSEADILVMPRQQNIDVIFSLKFNEPMEKSDIIIRAWDQFRNSKDIIFRNAIQVVDMKIPDEEFESSILELPKPIIDAEQFIPESLIAKWAGYSDEVSSDSEILNFLGIEGSKIPQWYKKEISKWLQEGSITHREFADSLKYFEQRGMLT